MKDKLKESSKAHVIYKLADGTRVCGVTTILSILAKPALIKWANNLGLQGIDSSKYTDSAARIGTLAHYMVQCYLSGDATDFSEYSNTEIDQAENALLSFFEWSKGHEIKPIFLEKGLVSETYQFGGTIDCYAEIDGKLTLCDFKTGSGIYEEHYYQLCAYRQLLFEHGHEVKKAIILNIPRKETEDFAEKVFTDFNNGWEIFHHCLALYNLKRAKS